MNTSPPSDKPNRKFEGRLTVKALKEMLQAFPDDMQVDVEIEQAYVVSPCFTELSVVVLNGVPPRMLLSAWEKAETEE